MTDRIEHLSEDQLQAQLDGTLSAALIGQVKEHLQACPTCQERLARLETLSAQLDRLPDLTLGYDLSPTVLSQLKGERKLSSRLIWLLAAEALGIGILIGILIPTLRATGWLLSIRQELQVALNIFSAQLASSWLVWWTGLKLQLIQIGQSWLSAASPSSLPLPPWMLVGAAAGLGLLLNTLLLRRGFLSGTNHKTQ